MPVVKKSKYVKEMQEITRQVARYKEIISSDNPGFQIIKSNDKIAVTKHIYTSDRTSVAGCYLEKGCKVEEHCHEETEIFILVKGHMTVIVNDEAYTLKAVDVLHMAPNIPHRVIAHKDSYLLAVAIPAAKDFPHA